MVRVLSVSAVHLSLQKSNPPTILVVADGMVSTPGWKNIDLVPMEKKLSADGILDLDFVGTPPTGIVPQVLRPVSGDFIITDDVERIVGVTVHTRTGSMTQLLTPSLTTIPTKADLLVGVTPPIGQNPATAAAAASLAPNSIFKSQVWGEEKIPHPQAEKFALRPAETIFFDPAETLWVGETSPMIDDPKRPFETTKPFENGGFGSFIGENGPDPLDPFRSVINRSPFGSF